MHIFYMQICTKLFPLIWFPTEASSFGWTQGCIILGDGLVGLMVRAPDGSLVALHQTGTVGNTGFTKLNQHLQTL